jgi:hypothetical protein
MQVLTKIIVTAMLILIGLTVLNSAMAEAPAKPQPVSKGTDKITDLSNGAIYSGPTEAELAKLAQMPTPTDKALTTPQESELPLSKPAEINTDLGFGVPYQGMSSKELEKLGQWQLFLSTSLTNPTNPKKEVITDLGAGQPYPGMNSAEKSKIQATTTNQK